ncbi:MAG: hypothetical protein ABFD80_00075 [Acidobacteriota bacterium]
MSVRNTPLSLRLLLAVGIVLLSAGAVPARISRAHGGQEAAPAKTQSPSPVRRPARLESFLNVAWGTSRWQAESVLKSLPGVGSFFPSNDHSSCEGPYSGHPASLRMDFYKNELYRGSALVHAGDGDVLAKYDEIKNELCLEYGQPDSEEGNSFEVMARWIFPADGEPDIVTLSIKRNPPVLSAPPPDRRFYVIVFFQNGRLNALAHPPAEEKSAL